MAEIKEFKSVQTIRNDQVVQLLREWLEEAEKGGITEIALAGIMPNNHTMTAASSAHSIGTLVGCIEVLKFRMLHGHFVESE